jgi:hypothetical protein
LRWATLILGVLGGLSLLIPLRRLTVVALVAAILSAGAGTAAFGAATATVAHSGSIPSSGPSAAAGAGGFGGGGTRPASDNSTGAPGDPTSAGSSSAGAPSGGMGGGSTSNSDLTALLKSSTTKWSAAISGATSAAELELSTGTSVIALGGWNGSDPSPTLAQFQKYATAGQIHYYISGGGMGGGGGTSTDSSQIATWVAAHYTAKTVGSTTVYDLTQPKSS